MPGPTLRARVGDIIQLTFINQIYANHFGLSIDNGETGVGCDQPVPPGDAFPDCFHGSSTGNIHFHGTHTNPNNTGDNVFIEVRPLPRDNAGKLTTSPEQVQKSLDKFFVQCAERLKGSALTQWPKAWSDMPPDWTGQQKSLLQEYDKQLAQRYGVPPAKQLWPIDKMQLDAGGWPQYYDVGANAESRPEHLVQFAHMGVVFAEEMLGVTEPEVRLLSIGEEDEKGNALTLDAHALLRSSDLNFAGNAESRELLRGATDVLVCDGFTGNVALKLLEGTIKTLLDALRDEISATPRGKLGGLLIRPAARRLRAQLDPDTYGGAYLLGLRGLVVIAHGNSSSKAIANAILLAILH